MKRFLYFILMISIMACETVVDIEVPTPDPKLVVFSMLNPDSTLKVVVSRSRYILDQSDYQPVTTASVSIQNQLGEPINFVHQEKGVYISAYKPSAGTEYQLKVEAPGYEAVESSTVIPEPVEVLAVRLSDQVIVKDQTEYYRLTVEFQDEPGENYYQVYLNTTQYYNVPVWEYPDSINVVPVSSNLFFEPEDPALEQDTDFGDGLLIEDATFNGRLYSLQLLVTRYAFEFMNGEPQFMDVHINLMHLNPDYYFFERTRRLQDYNDGNPFAEPTPVFNNITNGMGLFSGLSTYSKDFRYSK